MKISVSGCAGCGKTTLANALAKQLELPMIEENYQPLAEASGAPDEFLERVQEVLEYKAALEAEHVSFVSDRGPIDLLHQALRQRPLPGLRQRVVAIMNRAVELARSHDYVIFPAWQSSRLEPSEPGTPVRNLNPLVQLQAHGAMLGQAHIWLDAKRVLQLPPAITGVNDRVQFVCHALEMAGRGG